MVRDYELVYIVSPEVSDETLQSISERISQFITSRDGAILKSESWGKRKLAYPIRRFREGIYYLTQFKISPDQARELENTLHLSEDVIRHLLVRLEVKELALPTQPTE